MGINALEESGLTTSNINQRFLTATGGSETSYDFFHIEAILFGFFLSDAMSLDGRKDSRDPKKQLDNWSPGARPALLHFVVAPDLQLQNLLQASACSACAVQKS